ncbi:hypothetical protein AGMMS50267_14820 [Spirochaetia bacterium]|nr:hypothetical protein AGMMS50267_14820 [Spirochaetia bacterium]
MENEGKEVTAWFNVLNAAMKIPGAKVNRTHFLEKEFGRFYENSDLQNIIQIGTQRAGVDIKRMDRIADGVIKYHTLLVTSISAVAGLPGGWWMAGTIPADLTQYYYHVIVIAQKIAYIYGWPEFDGDASDDFLLTLTIFIGVMSGAKAANEAIEIISKLLAKEIVKRLPKMALTKLGIFQIAKQIAKWLGVKLTKDIFAKGVGKAVPIAGSVISGGITLATFLPMAKRLKKKLKEELLENLA